jgi:hypothetical protein
MLRMQKVWLGIFLAMFIVPEVLWSPILSFGSELLQTGNTHPIRFNYLTNLQHKGILIFVLAFESLGLLLALILLFNAYKNKKNLVFFLAQSFLLILFLISLLVIYFFFVFSHGISF